MWLAMSERADTRIAACNKTVCSIKVHGCSVRGSKGSCSRAHQPGTRMRVSKRAGRQVDGWNKKNQLHSNQTARVRFLNGKLESAVNCYIRLPGVCDTQQVQNKADRNDTWTQNRFATQNQSRWSKITGSNETAKP